MAGRGVSGNPHLGLRILTRLGRDAVWIRVMGEIAPPLPDRAYRPVRAADPGFRNRQLRDFS